MPDRHLDKTYEPPPFKRKPKINGFEFTHKLCVSFSKSPDYTDMMDVNPHEIADRRQNAVELLRNYCEDRWKQLAENTSLTEKQIAMWELAVVYDQKNAYIAREYGIRVTTVARHCERVREKRDELKEEFERIQNTLGYFEDTETLDS